MRPKEIQKLIELVERSGIGELEVSRWGKKVRIRKYTENNLPMTNVPENIIIERNSKSPTTAQAPIPPTHGEQALEELPLEEPSAEAKKFIEIHSPMVGTFYRASAPDAEPYVQIGDTVSQGQVLCIIEAMKLMNEIEAEFPCRITEVLVEDAQPVEYNQALYKAEKI